MDELQERAAEILGYRFAQPSLLAEAMTHASSAGHRLQSNERLEFLGDAILGYVVCEELFERYPELLEGELTKIKSAVVSRRVCAKVSRAMGLADMLTLGKGMAGQRQLPPSVSAAVFESVIAAIYLDGGIEPVRRFILRHLRPVIQDAAASAHQQNFKSVLQQHAQKHLAGHPVYLLLDEKGPDHAKAFEVCVEIAGQRFDSAWANSKKEAEQQAALHALAALGVVTLDASGDVTLIETLDAEASAGEPDAPDTTA